MITGIGHVAITVSDLDRSLAFYRDVLGFPEAFRLTDEAGEPWLVYLRVSETNFIELFPGGESRPEPKGRPMGYVHLCLLVDDMEGTLKELGERGAERSGTVTRGRDGNTQYWLTDPDGNRIELMQIMPGSLQATSAR